MALLCFLLDLRSLSPPLVKALKQYLLKLANLYAILCGRCNRESAMLADRIGLCYVHRNRLSCSDELKVSYAPRGNFSLRDFHRAVNNVPTDFFLPQCSDFRAAGTSDLDSILPRLLTKEVLYSWGGKDVSSKLISITSCLPQYSEVLRTTLTDAAEQCVSVEFVLLQQETIEVDDMSECVKEFTNGIGELQNCVLRRYFPVDKWVLCGLVQRWHQELKDVGEQSWEAVLFFQNNVVDSTNQIFCNLFPSTKQIIDGFSPCQACSCHGLTIEGLRNNMTKRPSSCPVTSHELEACDVIENAVKVGEKTVLFLPSFHSFPELHEVSAPITFNVIERTNLASLSEGVIMGASYLVTPSNHDMEPFSDEQDKPELNIRIFHALCGALCSLDQGLVCTSYCNMETMREVTFQCFYVLQASDKGPMLLRKLAGAEEIFPILDAIGSIDPVVRNEIENSIEVSLSKIEVKDYNPLLHERGFHPKLNWLIKESLHFGSIPPNRRESSPENSSSRLQPSTEEQAIEEERQPTGTSSGAEDSACLTEEWEQLIVHEIGDTFSPTCISKSVLENSVLSSTNKHLDEKTSRILERLEGPRQQQKSLATFPVHVSKSKSDAIGPAKKPLVPLVPNHALEQGIGLTQPMKPNFERVKRKFR